MIHYIRIFFVLQLVIAWPAQGAFWGYEGAQRQFHGIVWQAHLDAFSEAAYFDALNNVIQEFERATDRRLAPAAAHRAGIKLYTNAGPGMATPRNLVRALIHLLNERGFERDELFLLDVSESRLRESGYLPSLSHIRTEGYLFEGVPVYALDRDRYYDSIWFYENALPEKAYSAVQSEYSGGQITATDPDDRKSYLPADLVNGGVDFWINLPVVTDHPVIGINGVLANATLWNVSNRERFFQSASTAPVAIAEIAAIPELQASWSMSILSLERYQFVAGPRFNAYYSTSEPVLWLSADPVILDALALAKMNRARTEMGFHQINPALPLFDYCQVLGVGQYEIDGTRWIGAETQPVRR